MTAMNLHLSVSVVKKTALKQPAKLEQAVEDRRGYQQENIDEEPITSSFLPDLFRKSTTIQSSKVGAA